METVGRSGHGYEISTRLFRRRLLLIVWGWQRLPLCWGQVLHAVGKVNTVISTPSVEIVISIGVPLILLYRTGMRMRVAGGRSTERVVATEMRSALIRRGIRMG